MTAGKCQRVVVGYRVTMTTDIEKRLDSFDADVRRQALDELAALVRAGDVSLPEPSPIANMHAHTFYSYNAHGYSPGHIAWLARKKGHELVGIIDFDVLDGLDEFLRAGDLLVIKTCVGIESRVFIPEFSDRVINSPGEPGIAYHMGVGFSSTKLPPSAASFMAKMRDTAQQRNRSLIDRVNSYTKPVLLDYDNDVLPLTPSGNATERHICLAYTRKAASHFKKESDLLDYWSDKLDTDVAKLDLPDGPELQSVLRAKTMKRGGVGYVQPDKGSFPRMADMNRFSEESGAIPMMSWLNGTSNGEQCIEELMETSIKARTAALNVIPQRNLGPSPGAPSDTLQALYDLISLAKQHGLPVIAGTEMNSPDLPFVDDIWSEQLAPVAPEFVRGARIMYAHTLLHKEERLGYLSDWAKEKYPDQNDRNEFFARLGEKGTIEEL